MATRCHHLQVREAFVTYGFCADPEPREEAIQGVQVGDRRQPARSSVRRSSGQANSYIVEIAGTGADPEQARDVTNVAADAAVQVSAKRFSEESRVNAENLAAEAQAAADTLDKATQAVTDFRIGRNMTDAERQAVTDAAGASSAEGKAVDIAVELAGARSELITLAASLEAASKSQQSSQDIVTGRSTNRITTNSPNPVYNELVVANEKLKARIADLEAQAAALAARPAVVENAKLTQDQTELLGLERAVELAKDNQSVIDKRYRAALVDASAFVERTDTYRHGFAAHLSRRASENPLSRARAPVRCHCRRLPDLATGVAACGLRGRPGPPRRLRQWWLPQREPAVHRPHDQPTRGGGRKQRGYRRARCSRRASRPMTIETEATGRRVLIATSAQLGVKVAHLVLNVASTLIVVRYLPRGQFGEYVIVLTTSLLAGLVAEFGLPKLAVREIMRGPDDRDAILGTVIGLRCGFALVGTLTAQAILLAVDGSGAAHVAALIASGVLWFDVLYTIIVVTHTEMRQQFEALVRLVMELVEITVLIILVRRGASLPVLFFAPVAGAAVGAAGAQMLARRRFGVRPRFDRGHAGPLLRQAFVIGPTVIIGVAYLKSDGLILAARRSTSEVAEYGAAAQPIEYLFLASAVVIGVLFPLLAQAFAAGNGERFGSSYRIGTEILFSGSLAVPLAVAISGPSIVDLAYAGKYPGAATPLLVLAVAFVLMVGNAWRSFVLLAAGEQAVTLRYDLAACVVAVCAGFLLVGRWGATGAALATLATAVFVTAASLVAMRRCVAVTLSARPLIMSIGAAGIGLGLGLAAGATGAGPFTRTCLAVVVYLLLIAALAPPRLRELVATRPPEAVRPDVGDVVVDLRDHSSIAPRDAAPVPTPDRRGSR